MKTLPVSVGTSGSELFSQQDSVIIQRNVPSDSMHQSGTWQLSHSSQRTKSFCSCFVCKFRGTGFPNSSSIAGFLSTFTQHQRPVVIAVLTRSIN